jgi:hypothetical protein
MLKLQLSSHGKVTFLAWDCVCSLLWNEDDIRTGGRAWPLPLGQLEASTVVGCSIFGVLVAYYQLAAVHATPSGA